MSRYKPDTRAAFSRQPAHYLLFDVGQPMTSTQMRNAITVFLTLQHNWKSLKKRFKSCWLSNVFLQAVQNVLVLACSIRGGSRIPAFGLAMINQNFQNVYSLEAIRGNFSKIAAAFNSLSYQVNYITVRLSFPKNKIWKFYTICNNELYCIIVYIPVSCRQKSVKKCLFKSLRTIFIWQ